MMDLDETLEIGQIIALTLGIIWVLFIISAISFGLYILYKYLLG